VQAGRWLVAACLLGLATLAAAASLPLEKLQLPAGFRIEVLTDAVPNARAMTLGRFANGRGVVYVGSGRAGKVYAVEIDAGRATAVHTVASGLTLPIGVAWHDGQLYVSAVAKILRLDAIDTHLKDPPKPQVVTDRLPDELPHGGRFIAFGPDGMLYFAVGAPCNICRPDAGRYANIQRMKPDGSDLQRVAHGVRNSVGFDWSPLDETLWFTDNGRDLMGDDVPSDELNHVTGRDPDFGYPYCHAGDVADPQFGKGRPCSEFVAPAAQLGAHVAALGMRFYTGSMFPEEYRHNIFIAEHGSWNRSRKVGYRVVRIVLDSHGKVVSDTPFVSGWLQQGAGGAESVWGRPVDVLVLPDGSLLISDDAAGAIYRVTHAR
jgi:glucose/arabinose dehydrogenase